MTRMRKHSEDGMRPDIDRCFQEFMETIVTAPTSRAKSGWCRQPHNPARPSYPHFSLITPGCQGNRSSSVILLFLYFLRYVPFLLTIYKEEMGEKFRAG